MTRPLSSNRSLFRHANVCAALIAIAVLGSGIGAPIVDSVRADPTMGGAIPGPLPIFPPDNWWNLDISAAPVDPASTAYINFIGATRTALDRQRGCVALG